MHYKKRLDDHAFQKGIQESDYGGGYGKNSQGAYIWKIAAGTKRTLQSFLFNDGLAGEEMMCHNSSKIAGGITSKERYQCFLLQFHLVER